MAIYPAFVVSYLGKFNAQLTNGWHGYAWSLAVVALCCAWNLRGAPAVGDDSVWMSALLLAPFAVLVVIGMWHGVRLHPAVQWSSPASGSALSTAILVAMWNYMGWDNASTVAQEVDDPQRTYPRAMIAATVLVAITYILPLGAIALAGIPVNSFSTGDWTTAAATIGGPLLGTAIACGGVITGVGMFNALVMSYSRLPMAMAEDGMLPGWIAKRNNRDTPWVSVVLCGLAWGLALKLPFEKLISIDLVLYGSSLLLEFVALAVLRWREPDLARPFKAGSLAFACSLGVGPAAAIAYALYVSRTEEVKIGSSSVSALVFSVAIGLLGPFFYWLTAVSRARRTPAVEPVGD
jgi:amino acid transporter